MIHRLDIRVYFPVTMSLYLFQAFPCGWLCLNIPGVSITILDSFDCFCPIGRDGEGT